MKPVQLPIFDQPTLNISADLTRAMHDAVKKSDMSREQIVDRMNDLADRYGVRMVNGNTTKLTMTTFEKWINPDDLSRQIPLRALPVFCAAIGRPDICDIILKPLSCRVIGHEDISLLKWAKAYFRQKQAAREMRELEKFI